MAQNVTLGGDRLGSGHKQQVELHNYGMNSFNLEQDFKSSMAPGILYPFIKLVGTNHGTFDIDLDTFVRTIPTRGPLFGSFKLQLDLFNVPIRLYQGILHNNPVGIGLKMNQVYLPKLVLGTWDGNEKIRPYGSNKYNYQINESSLMKYLGLSGLGTIGNGENNIYRKINAIPALAYYDIFKCYYSNKQEEKAYVITPNIKADYYGEITKIANRTNEEIDPTTQYGFDIHDFPALIGASYLLKIYGKNIQIDNIEIYFNDSQGDNYTDFELKSLLQNGKATIIKQEDNEIWLELFLNLMEQRPWAQDIYYLNIGYVENKQIYASNIQLTAFDLKNIDEMRNRLLSANTLGSEFLIDGETNLMPYSALVERNNGITWNAFPENGLVVKTYQSDLFNNWLDSEIIDGENGIAAISAVAVSDGSFTIDSLNFAQKIYEVLNRVAVSGGTYEDWQEAVYGEGAVRKAETPMYVGGMAAEVMFEEVISSSETNVDGDKQALGSLAGKGTQVGKKGGNNIHIKCEEPSYIMGIVSLTPRICYSQGNDWDLTELDTLDDLHKPGLDGIGFQDLMVEQFAWWSTICAANGSVAQRQSAGKQTAWINYQTAVDKCYGDFAKQDGYAFMVLNRNYEREGENEWDVKDVTTYIDPAKYNYAFAYQALDAQNFWVQIHSKVTARRKMGAQQIPNL